MNVYRNLDSLPHLNKVVLTIGVFDGVHLGHKELIRQLLEEAQRVQGEAVLVTFHPHPRTVLQSSEPVKVLNTENEKLALIEATGVQHLIVVPFSKAFASLSPEEYVTDFLVKRFHPHTIIIGYDHRFGKDRKGDYMLLHQLGEQHNFVVKEIPEHVLRNITISSTRIRKALMEGDVTTANHFLGYPYPLSGTVVHGNKRGRTIGFPTANIQPEAAEKLTPAVGVYAVDVLVDGEQFRGMMNIGYRPTVDGSSLTVEVHILDFDRDIYDRSITVKMLSRLRDEKKFAGLDELKQQLGLDRKNAAAV